MSGLARNFDLASASLRELNHYCLLYTSDAADE